jgi:hypothetical protein
VRASLIVVFPLPGKGILFLETVASVGGRRRHTVIEAVPVPRSVAADAPLFFKQVRVGGRAGGRERIERPLLSTGDC